MNQMCGNRQTGRRARPNSRGEGSRRTFQLRRRRLQPWRRTRQLRRRTLQLGRRTLQLRRRPKQ